jgi:hypothetical protein
MARAIYENKTPITGDFPQRTYPLIEIVQIRAAAQRDVLTIIDLLAIRQAIGGCSATQKRALLEQSNPESGFS